MQFIKDYLIMSKGQSFFQEVLSPADKKMYQFNRGSFDLMSFPQKMPKISFFFTFSSVWLNNFLRNQVPFYNLVPCATCLLGFLKKVHCLEAEAKGLGKVPSPMRMGLSAFPTPESAFVWIIFFNRWFRMKCSSEFRLDSNIIFWISIELVKRVNCNFVGDNVWSNEKHGDSVAENRNVMNILPQVDKTLPSDPALHPSWK